MSYIKALLLMLTVAVVAACSPSAEEAFSQAESEVRSVVLSSEEIETNYSFDRFDAYKPDDFQVTDANPHNVVFNDGGQPYVLFVNEFEAPNSQWFYNRISDEGVYLRTIETEDAFAYIHAIEHGDDQYEVHLGIGGIKMSTITSLSQVEDDAKLMIEIISSVEQIEEDEGEDEE
ncbi:hypothetical protein [Alkalibacillus haloalkaliphilus]|uniref:DUF4367 domain-containing protein n=1 Tax=Alkalibacillus haloalkaliphilus TaxID=94136 RepID=A0A511W4E2_9BACI|nr:hypothetical protein [Alkalibacillus haloalkaliphilus]GEN45945.1 hypothetical protein AHA02nite_17210 [Alkalibacillus haloalkaliphilus]